MTRRTISVALIVLGAIAVLAAIASATIWRPTDTATLSLPSRPEAPVVVSDAGLLDAVGPDVRIRATAGDDEPVVLAVARTADVDAWVGPAAHTRITGLASWEQLEVEDVAADEGTEEPTEETTAEPAEPAALPDPAGSDLWVVEQTGTGSAEINWADRDGRWSLLAATDGTAPAPELSMTWDVEVRTPWLVPGLVIGGLLLIAGLALLALEILADREARRRPAPAPAGGPAGADDETAVLPAAAGAGLTRRELRERERAEARRRGRTGEIPVVATTGEIPVTTSEASAADGDLRDAGAARGAGIVPASGRAEELRAGREPRTDVGTQAEGAGAPQPATAVPGAGESEVSTPSAGVARGAGVVPAAGIEHRADREVAEEGVAFDEEAARWTEGETADETATAPDQETSAMPVVGPEETAAMPVVESTEETAAMPVVGSTEETAAMPVVESTGQTAATPVVGPAEDGSTNVDERDEDAEETDRHERAEDRPEDRSGWRSLWGFGGRRPTGHEGEEQR